MIGEVMFDAGYFHLAYGKLLKELLDSDIEETNRRTGSKIKTLPGGVSFKVRLSSGFLPTCGHRKLHPKTAAAEVAWFLSGEKDVTWLAKHAPIWNKFVEDDGKTIEAAYGYRWASHFGRNQLQLAIGALHDNPSDRRVYVSTWDPGSDGLGAAGQRNVPCPVGFTLSLVGNQLHSSIALRSSDVFVGLPYDVMGHAILMQVVLDSLNELLSLMDSDYIDAPPRPPLYELGSMHVTLAHPHLYEAHYEMARHAVEQVTIFESPHLQEGWTLARITDSPDEFVRQYAEESKHAIWPKYNPKPELIV